MLDVKAILWLENYLQVTLNFVIIFNEKVWTFFSGKVWEKFSHFVVDTMSMVDTWYLAMVNTWYLITSVDHVFCLYISLLFQWILQTKFI